MNSHSWGVAKPAFSFDHASPVHLVQVPILPPAGSRNQTAIHLWTPLANAYRSHRSSRYYPENIEKRGRRGVDEVRMLSPLLIQYFHSPNYYFKRWLASKILLTVYRNDVLKFRMPTKMKRQLGVDKQRAANSQRPFRLGHDEWSRPTIHI